MVDQTDDVVMTGRLTGPSGTRAMQILSLQTGKAAVTMTIPPPSPGGPGSGIVQRLLSHDPDCSADRCPDRPCYHSATQRPRGGAFRRIVAASCQQQ
jgi:hypothetical protein